MKMGQKLERVVDVITEVLAFFTIALIAFLYLNAMDAVTIISNISVLNVLNVIREYAVLGIVALAGLQFALKRGFIVFIIYAAIVAFTVIIMFFPGVLPIA